MPYIASNGELYDDEEIFNIVDNNDESEVQEFNFQLADEVAMMWERKMCI